ncbi:amidase [Poronia punctata]|nr:amidase [Poronia punctata]
MMEPYELTATQALSSIRSGALTVEQYARSLLQRISTRDDVVKAWAYLDPEYVIREAKRLDAVPVTERGPLHGLPVAVKDIIYTRDMPTQFNSPIYKDNAPNVDAACVMVLRQAGALILGKTTTTEFASASGTSPTTNPHSSLRTPGGSSSGSAASVADFQCALSIGSQTGGSIIRPASFNGIYGYKPTWGAISREGLKLYSYTYDTIGFFSRSVSDLELIADVYNLEKKDADDKDRKFSLQGARFAVVRQPSSASSLAGLATWAALHGAMKLLRKHGAFVDEEITLPPDFDKMPKWYDDLLKSEARATFLPEYLVAKDKLSAFLVGQVENTVSRAEQVEAMDRLAALRPVLDGILTGKREGKGGGYDAIITPSTLGEAPLGLESTGSPAYNSMWTALHTPVVNVPGFDGVNNMPVGVSLVGPRFHDRRLLAVAEAVGKVFEEEGMWKLKVHGV